ncbi:MAG: hypothetical protein OHK005_04910 [Candidatus Methylacidiphilales bacterium]
MMTKSIVLVLLLAVTFATGLPAAQDKITLRTGQVIEGEVKRFDRDRQQVVVAEARGEIPFPLANIVEIKLSPRPEIDEARNAVSEGNAAKAVKILEPIVSNLVGLDDPLASESAGLLADAYSRANETAKANELFALIDKVYPNSIYRLQGRIIQARSQARGGATDAALRTLGEVENEVKHGAIPDLSSMQIMGDLLMTRAEILEKQGKKADAFSDYMKVMVIYYLPESRARQAAEAVQKLRQLDQSLVVN